MSSKFVGKIGTISSSQEKKYTFHWNIEKFSSLSDQVDEYYQSPYFYFKRSKCYLQFFPNGRSPHSVKYFSLYFFSPDYTNILHVKLGIKTRNGCTEEWFSRNVSSRDSGLGLEDVIHRSDFLKRKSELASSDCITFVLILSSEAPKLIKDFFHVSVQTEPNTLEENDKETSGKKGGDKAVSDIGHLLDSGQRSDVVIHVEDTEFKVHGCILAARTPVFSALFEHEFIEKISNKITIRDCEPSIFKEFLNYIYTGNVQNLTTETAFDLYHVADKYLVSDLKDVCRKDIQNTLSIDSLCGAIELALRYGEQELLQSAIDYVVMNFEFVSQSVEWQRYVEENPKDANKILMKAFSKYRDLNVEGSSGTRRLKVYTSCSKILIMYLRLISFELTKLLIQL